MMLKQHFAFALLLCTSISVGIGARTETAYAATVATATVATGDAVAGCRPSESPLTDAQMNNTVAGEPMDAICLVAGICTGFWPLGTLICGPTTIGCVIYYWQEE